MEQPSLLSDWNIIGHKAIIDRLSRAVHYNEISHAYCLAGPDHIGKTTVARTFGQALLCTNDHLRPCGNCRACKLVQSNRHPDFCSLNMAWQEVALGIKGTAVSVDAVRHITTELHRRPYEGGYKVLFVPNAEELTTAAANAFLKTLEEPPPYVVILLTVRDIELLLPTIRSRCHPLALSPLSIEEVEHALVDRYNVSTDQAHLLARLSGGRVGWAINAIQERTALPQRAAALATLLQAWQTTRAERLLLAAPLAKANDDEIMPLWASWWRDVLLVQNGVIEAIQNIDQRDHLQRAAQDCTPAQVRSFLHDLQRLRRIATGTNASPQLVWETLMLKLPFSNN